MKTLCLYYTRTNTTKEVMTQIARTLGADLAEYTDGKESAAYAAALESYQQEPAPRF